MKQLFAFASLFVICYFVQIQAQLYKETTTPSVRRRYSNGTQNLSQNTYIADYNNYEARLRLQQGGQSFNGLSNAQFLSNTPNQPQIQQRNSLTEEQPRQPNHNYNLYQPIPSYSVNSYNPINEQELNQYGGKGPEPLVIAAPTITTQPPPVQLNPNAAYPESPYINYPPSSPIPQGQQYQPTGSRQPIGPDEQNHSPTYPAVPNVNQNFNKYEFMTHFSWKLFQNSKRHLSSGSNIVISPLSVQLLLSLVEQASAGTTKYQLQTVIGNSSPLDIGQAVNQVTFIRSKNKLKIGSAMFPSIRLTLNETFQDIARNSYVDVIPVDFNDQARAQRTINSWAASSTANKITNIFSGSQPNADLILTNAVYFDGAWKYPFNQTIVARFFQQPNLQKDVTYLKETATLMYGTKNYKGIQINWVELPYETDDFSMVIMLPNEFKLDELIEKVTESFFTGLLSELESGEKRRVHLRLPKFEMKIQMPLKNILQNIGISDAFTENANIPYLARDKVKINDAQQDVYLKVDEKGTTAAAVTTFSVITLSSSSYDPEEIEFDVNQPFLMVILHKQTRLPIFIGKIFNP